MSFPYIEEDFISLSECQRLIDYATLNKSENVSRDDVYSTDMNGLIMALHIMVIMLIL